MNIEVLGLGPVARPAPGEGCDYQQVGSMAELVEYLRPAWQDRIPFAADWEASSLNPVIARPAGLAVSISEKSGRYVPVGHLLEPETNLPAREVIEVLQRCDRAGAESIWFNAVGYDFDVMDQSFGWIPTRWRDVYIDVFLVDSNVIELGLKSSGLRFLGVKMQTIEELDEEWITLSKKEQKRRGLKPPTEYPPGRVTPYACGDADVTRRIEFHPAVQAAVREQSGIRQLEELFSPVLRRGNRHGVYLSCERLLTLRGEAEAKIASLRPQIWAQLGEEFPLSRKAYLAQKLLDLGLPVEERTKGGAPTVAVKVLEKYKKAHPVVPLLIQYAQLVAQKENYIDKLLKAQEYFSQQPWAEGRVRFAFSALGVPTGRMKCGGGGKGGEAYDKGVVDVNAQSIPDHEKAPHLVNVRSAFVAPPAFVVVALDYSQIELRLPANLAKEPAWMRTFQDPDGDIHVTNAQMVANTLEPGVVVQKSDKARRGKAKSVSFALLYGGDERTIARNSGMPVKEAKVLLDAFFAGLPRLKVWIDQQKAHAEAHKSCRTFMGRVRPLAKYFTPEPPKPPRGASKDDPVRKTWIRWVQQRDLGYREAINHPIQGGAADIFKTACILVERAIRQQGWDASIVSPQVLWVHDELVVYVHRDWVTRVVPVLQQAMEFPVTGWVVPLKVAVEVGSRALYLEDRMAQATRAGDIVLSEALQRQKDALPDDPTGEQSSWGEMVGYDQWVARYGIIMASASATV